MKRGFTLVEIMIVVAIIALLAAIAIPNLLRARLQTNESASQAALKTIATAEVTYRSAGDTYGTLDNLGTPTVGPAYIDRVLGCNTTPCVKSGYNFTANATANTFVSTAIPNLQNITGIRKFCITEDGVVRVNDAVSGSTSHDTCQGYDATAP